MRRFIGFVVAGLVFLSGGPISAQQDISVDLSVDGYSGYIWRGGVLGADDKLALQPSLTFGFGETGVSLNIWGSAFASSRSLLKGSDELDFTGDFSGSFSEDSPVGFSIGYIQYTFPNGASGEKHSEEVYGGLSLDNALAPSLTAYYDFGLIDEYYVVLSVGPELPLGEGEGAPSLALGGSVAFSGKGYGGKAGFNDVTLTASIGLGAGQVSLSPIVGVSFNDLKSEAEDTYFWGGISIGFSPTSE